MKKFVSMVCALAVAAVLAVPAMAADNSAVIAALQNAGASASQVSAAQTYLDAVDLSAETLDTVVANVNSAAALASDPAANGVAIRGLVQSTVNTINADPAAANNQLELRVTLIGDVASAAVICNGQDVKVNAGGEVNTKTGAVSAIGGQTSGSTTTTNPIKATGASMNMTAAVVAALAMAATMGSAVVYSAKKGLLAK